jgi:hypothetical protein
MARSCILGTHLHETIISPQNTLRLVEESVLCASSGKLETWGELKNRFINDGVRWQRAIFQLAATQLLWQATMCVENGDFSSPLKILFHGWW